MGLQKIDLSSGSGWSPASIPFSTSSSILSEVKAVDPLSRKEPIEELLGYLPTESEQSAAAGITAAVSSMTFSPSNNQVAYVGTNGSGIYKTTNGGISWNSAGLAGASISSIAVHPSNPDLVYVATTQPGIMKISTDGGATWGNLPAIPGSANVYSLVILQNEPDVVFAGTSNGIWKYDTASWVFAGISSTAITVLKSNSNTPSMLYAGTANGAYFSLDHMNWTLISPESYGYGIGAIALAEQNNEEFIFLGTSTRGTLQVSIP